MKKLSILFAALLLASFAMAQNKAIVSTTGNYNDANITQGVANNNWASILQVQNAEVGYHALATIDQGAASWAKITQLNYRNYATINEALSDRAEIYQDGKVNSSTISFGWSQGYNAGYVEQIGEYNGGNIYSTGQYNGTQDDPLLIKQHGNQNNAVIESGWNAPASNRDKASIIQTGNENTSKVKQEGGDYNEARITQTGNENHADLTQTGGGLLAKIDQYNGNKNIVNLKQTGGIVDIDQNGSENEVRGLQTPSPDIWATFAGSTLDVNQLGTGNTLDLKSASPGAIVNVYQNGITNTSVVIQN